MDLLDTRLARLDNIHVCVWSVVQYATASRNGLSNMNKALDRSLDGSFFQSKVNIWQIQQRDERKWKHKLPDGGQKETRKKKKCKSTQTNSILKGYFFNSILITPRHTKQRKHTITHDECSSMSLDTDIWTHHIIRPKIGLIGLLLTLTPSDTKHQ